jgi:hypothetical protein
MWNERERIRAMECGAAARALAKPAFAGVQFQPEGVGGGLSEALRIQD